MQILLYLKLTREQMFDLGSAFPPLYWKTVTFGALQSGSNTQHSINGCWKGLLQAITETK